MEIKTTEAVMETNEKNSVGSAYHAHEERV